MTVSTHRTTRWTVAVLAVVALLIVGYAVELRHTSSGPAGVTPGSTAPGTEQEHRDADTPAALAGPRQRAHLPPCRAAVNTVP
ncbi:MAG: TlpA family protein disulfide reductase, partial [Mycobacterium sp.]